MYLTEIRAYVNRFSFAVWFSKKKLSCSHAIYALRSITDYYTEGSSTVNVAFLDMSSAFDKVIYDVLFKKLIKLGLPPSVIKLLYFWYMNSNVYVRWGMCTSFTFHA